MALSAARGKAGHAAPDRARAARKASLKALDAPALLLNLFDNTEVAVTRTKVERPRADRLVWHGRGADGSQVALSLVRGALAGTGYSFGQTFDIVSDGNGLYRISELDSAAFPTDDPEFDAIPAADAKGAGKGVTATAPAIVRRRVPQIDVMVVWTPAARNAVGGAQAAIDSLIQSAVANANLAYANSGINAQLRLVHSEEVNFTETSIQTDLCAPDSGDGMLDRVQSLRDQYGADIVTLWQRLRVASARLGTGSLLSTASTSFPAPWAFNVVVQSCAAGYCLTRTKSVTTKGCITTRPMPGGPRRIRTRTATRTRAACSDRARLRRSATRPFFSNRMSCTTRCRRARRARTTRPRST